MTDEELMRLALAEAEKVFSDDSYRSHGKILIIP